jgi:hypothetical protein
MNLNNNITQQNILRKQQETTAKINSLLESSAELLACGPTCQKLKVSEELKQKYLNAETNMITAPEQLKTAKRNYYVYTEGESSYNNMLQQELTNTASDIATTLENSFQQVVDYSKTMNNYYYSALLNALNSDDLLNEYTDKNTNLTKDLTNIRGDIITNDRKTVYEEEAINRVKSWYTLFWYIYYIFVLSYLFALFLVPTPISILMRIIIFILLLFYPYYIDIIFKIIYGFIQNIYTIFPKNVYNSL